MALAVFDIDDSGWCAAARRVPSPNFDLRQPDIPVDLLLIHNISLPPGEFGGPYIEALFCNHLDFDAHPYFAQLRSLRVSAHFLIRRDGSLLQFVSTHARAWHAGVSVFAGRERCNDFSIGVEMEGSDFVAFETAQYLTLAALTLALSRHHGLADVAGHEDVAPGRKTDPGPCFDWQRYRTAFLESAAGSAAVDAVGAVGATARAGGAVAEFAGAASDPVAAPPTPAAARQDALALRFRAIPPLV